MSKYIIEWSDEAKQTSKEISDHLYQSWGKLAANDFGQKVALLLRGLSSNKELCPKSKVKKLRKCVVSKQSSLIYHVNRNTITLVTFIDNRSNHIY